MANYQVLFYGEVMASANPDAVRDNLARELGLDARKAKQLFSGRTVVIRSQLEQREAQHWQERFAELGAICRIKNLEPKVEPLGMRDSLGDDKDHERTLRDITAAHLECPRCGHEQLDASHCARCGVDLEAAFRQKHKEDLMIEKKLRDLRNRRELDAQQQAQQSKVSPIHSPAREQTQEKRGGVLRWLKRS